MAVSRSLRRLARVRALEEEQSLAILEVAMSEVRRLEMTIDAMAQREQMGRELVHRSAKTGEVLERVAGLAEQRMAGRALGVLKDYLEDAQETATEARAAFLARRVEKRQVGSLLESALKREEANRARHQQQDVEDWDRARRMRGEGIRVVAGSAEQDKNSIANAATSVAP